jgi:hypothetical protein
MIVIMENWKMEKWENLKTAIRSGRYLRVEDNFSGRILKPNFTFYPACRRAACLPQAGFRL